MLRSIHNTIQDAIEPGVSYKRRVTIIDPPNLAELITSLDDKTLRHILRVPKAVDEKEVSEN